MNLGFNLKLFRKKRTALFLLLALLVILFYKSDWVLKFVYPIHYWQSIQESGQRYQVDPLLIAAVIRAETNYKPDMVSSKGAIGIMQIMPDTATWIFEQEDRFQRYTLKDLDNPEKNIQVGTLYINVLQKKFDSLPEVAAAYNAGQGNVHKWLQNGIWDGTLENVEQIPFWETRKYVSRVTYYYHKYKSLYEEAVPSK